MNRVAVKTRRTTRPADAGGVKTTKRCVARAMAKDSSSSSSSRSNSKDSSLSRFNYVAEEANVAVSAEKPATGASGTRLIKETPCA